MCTLTNIFCHLRQHIYEEWKHIYDKMNTPTINTPSWWSTLVKYRNMFYNSHEHIFITNTNTFLIKTRINNKDKHKTRKTQGEHINIRQTQRPKTISTWTEERARLHWIESFQEWLHDKRSYLGCQRSKSMFEPSQPIIVNMPYISVSLNLVLYYWA